MPASLLQEWMEFEELEPFGPWRDNFHAGMIAATIANVNRNPKKNPQPVKISDFFYVDTATQQERADQSLLSALRSVKRKAH